MTKRPISLALLFPALLATASCGMQSTGDSPDANSTPIHAATDARPFKVIAHGSFDEPWAVAFAPGTNVIFITEKPGTMKFVDLPSGRTGTVTGLPDVDYGGQGGLGDIAFLPSESSPELGTRTLYLSWVEAGSGDTRGAAVGRGSLVCEEADACRIEGLNVIWRQKPKVTGRGHFSHRIAVAPDERSLFVSSGERQKGDPAQNPQVSLGKIVHLDLDGTPVGDGKLANEKGALPEIYSMGHRNVLGLQFDDSGRLWDLEHGPAGGDELNLVENGRNYGWPIVSNGDNYDGSPIPRHSSRPEFAAPAISWNPVIAPGDFTFYSGKLWPEWKGDAIIAAMKPSGLVRVKIDGTKATEAARYPFDKRIREVIEGPDGALWLLEDKAGGRLLELRPK